MISQVRGTLTHRGVDRVEILTASGLAYEIQIPLNVLEKLPREGAQAALHTSLVVRDDGWHLFGFNTATDRELFRLLLTASGVGPSLALNLLSALSPHRLVSSIRGRDVATLQRVPRVGKKTAERICIELGDKLKSWAGDDGSAPAAGPVSGDAVRALVSLGYSEAEADRAVRSVLDRAANAGSAELVKLALAALQGR